METQGFVWFKTSRWYVSIETPRMVGERKVKKKEKLKRTRFMYTNIHQVFPTKHAARDWLYDNGFEEIEQPPIVMD